MGHPRTRRSSIAAHVAKGEIARCQADEARLVRANSLMRASSPQPPSRASRVSKVTVMTVSLSHSLTNRSLAPVLNQSLSLSFARTLSLALALALLLLCRMYTATECTAH